MTKKHRHKIFIDTSVLIAAVLSNTGASNYIFRLAEKDIIDIILTVKVLKEARRNLLAKYGQISLKEMQELLIKHKKSIKQDIKKDTEEKFSDLIEDQNDLHILAGANAYKADYLITLDKKHFMTAKLKQSNLLFKIILPGKYLEKLREELENDL